MRDKIIKISLIGALGVGLVVGFLRGSDDFAVCAAGASGDGDGIALCVVRFGFFVTGTPILLVLLVAGIILVWQQRRPGGS